MMNDTTLLQRITFNPKIFSGKPVVRGRRLTPDCYNPAVAGSMPNLLEDAPRVVQAGK